MTHRYEFDVPNTNWQYVLICETEDLTGEGSTHSYGNMTSINLYRPQGLKPLLLPVVHKKAGLQSFVTWLPWAGHYAIAVAWNGPFVVGLYRSKHKLKDEELPWGILTKDFSRKWLAALADFEKILEEREVKRRDDELWEDYQARRRASERLRRGR